MGTQFSKTHKANRMEIHQNILLYEQPHNVLMSISHQKRPFSSLNPVGIEEDENGSSTEFYTRRAHHSGVLSGHELMSYSFLAGRTCPPRRSLRRKHRKESLSVGGSGRCTLSSVCSRTKSSYSRSVSSSDSRGSNVSEYELDSGISTITINNYPELYNFHHEPRPLIHLRSQKEGDDQSGENYYEVEETEEEDQPQYSSHEDDDTDSKLKNDNVMARTERLMTAALKGYYREHFSDWFEPGSQLSERSSIYRRSSRRKNLHQKLVLSKMSHKRATKLDMDDRAKMIHYFSSSNVENTENIRIEDMFLDVWNIPRPGPALPTIITVQAPAGIGKSSMLKYMCMKWGYDEMWVDKFDVVLFMECRTLNRFGSMTGREFLKSMLLPHRIKIEPNIIDDDLDEILDMLIVKSATGRVLLLLDGLDEVHGVGHLATLKVPISIHEAKLSCPVSKLSLNESDINVSETLLNPLEFTQCLLTGSLLSGCNIIVTSRPHTLSHLQSSKWFMSLPKRMISLDIQGLSDRGVSSFIHSYVDGRRLEGTLDEIECHEDRCPCRELQMSARSDPYIFSLATNPFYLWLICTIFTEAGKDFVPKTLTQLYTWVMLVFANRWQNKRSKSLTESCLEFNSVSFLLGFSKLCYFLVRSGNIKMKADIKKDEVAYINFPEFGNVTINRDRAETFGLMTVSQVGHQLECEFRHLSLAEYMTALHIHLTGDSLKDFPRDRKELILQYLSGLSSTSDERDQVVIRNFLACLGSTPESKDSLSYLKFIQKMKGEWYDKQGLQKQLLFMRCAFESRQNNLTMYPFAGLKVISIRGTSLLALDLIIIGRFVTTLADTNRLLELSIRDYPLDQNGLCGLSVCLPLVRSVTLCAKRLTDPSSYNIFLNAMTDPKSRLRELWLLNVPPFYTGLDEYDTEGADAMGSAILELRCAAKKWNVKFNV